MLNFSRSLLYVTALALFILLMGQGTLYAQNGGELVKMGEARGTARIQLWDTLSPFADTQDRANWKAISAGMELQGDMVLENDYLLVAFPSTSGKVMIHSKSGEKRAEIAPLHLAGKAANITACKILRNTGDEATIEVNFSADGRNSSIVFSFSKDQIVQIKPADNMDGVSIFSPIQFAIVPSFISDDLILAPRDYSLETLHIPSENLLLGLLSGADSMLAIVWPDGNQKVRVNAESEQLFKSVDFENDGKSLYIALLDAPGIWYEEVLQRTYLEKDIAIDWKRPFPAKWITQLYEDKVKTTYTFRESKKERYWRAGLGRYTYPVWFDGETTFLRLGKRIPPKEEALIYCLERKGTPVSISTPVDILRKTLDSETYERIVDSEGRKNRSSNPPGCDYDAATCAATDRLKLIFEAGEETQKKDAIKTGTDDMSYFMSIERGRSEEYEVFAHEMLEWLAQMKNDRPELKEFLDEMEVLAREIIAVYEHEKGNIGSVEFSAELAAETQALARQKSPNNLEAFMKLKGRWTSMGGAVEDVNRGLHTTTRKMFQRAGYACVTQSEAVEVAQEIRSRIIKCLRRPSPYEIWSDY